MRLFFLVRNEDKKCACSGQAVIMIVSIAIMITFHIVLNMEFAPLLQSLPFAATSSNVKHNIYRRHDNRFKRNLNISFKTSRQIDV